MKRKLVNKTMIETIRVCVLERDMSDSEIAKQLAISVATVRKIRTTQLGIEKNTSGRVLSSPNFTSGLKDAKLGDYESDVDKRAALYDAFRASFRYQQVLQKYNQVSVENFINKWIDYQIQLPDMNVAEEDMLESMIDLKFRMDDNQKSVKNMRDQQNTILVEIKKNEPLDVLDPNHRALLEMSQSIEEKLTLINKDYKELIDKLNTIQKSLNMSREQREDQQKVGGDTFLKLIKELNDRETRQKIGDRGELLKLATANKVDKMKRPITFDDGTRDPILMSGKNAQKTENIEGSGLTK
jgi:hypothetical protein